MPVFVGFQPFHDVVVLVLVFIFHLHSSEHTMQYYTEEYLQDTKYDNIVFKAEKYYIGI